MRQIKFRAWNPELGRYTTGEFLLSACQKTEIKVVGVSVDGDAEDENEAVIIEQFTGLRDRNTREIYEGDIVKADFSKDGSHDSVQVIEFYEGSFGSRNKNDHFRIPALFSGRAIEGMNTNYFEVIGNIHQNPELLLVQSKLAE